MTDDMEKQLQKLGRSINDATREAYEVMVSSNGTIVGDIFANKENALNNKNDDEDDLTEGMSSGDNRAGMEMGLALFGTSDAYKIQMDEEFHGKLSAVEKELNDICEGLHSLREEEENNGNAGQDIDNDGGSDLDSGNNTHNVTTGDDEQQLASIDMIPHLQHHIQFLQRCARAKNLLENVEKMSFSNFATSSVVGGTGTEGNDHVNNSSVFLLSPSAQFSFQPAGKVLKDGKSPMVQAAHLIKEVDSILDSATSTLKDEFASSSRLTTQMQAKIFNELQMEACRFRSELKCRAITLIERCIVVEEGKLLVKGSGTASKHKPKVVGFNAEALSHDAAAAAIPPSPLSDAFEVLGSFSDPRFASFGETLDINMKKIAQKITGVFKARMATFESALTNGEVAMFTMREETINKTRRNELANVGGTSIQLVWASTTVKYVEQGGDDARDSSSSSVVSVAIDETLLLSAPSAAIATFISLLNYMTNLLVFVHDHALLGRPELSKILGKHIFQPELPELALRVDDEGILMTGLLAAMRKWCIPKRSSSQVWKTVQSVEQRLINEVGAFEDAMENLNFMNGSNVDGMDATTLSPLSKLANSLCQAYVETQRCQIINAGRNILLNTDYHNTTCVGHRVKDPSEPGSLDSLNDDPRSAFLFQECSVSVVAQEILQLCRRTLDNASDEEAATTMDTLPPSLYRASREVLDLFRAIIPTRHGKEIASIPRLAAILHNDCVYLAHEASFLGAEYKEKFSKDQSSSMKMLSEACTFVDMVPPFRDLASKSMGSMIEMQKVQLYELVSHRLATSFTNALGSNEAVSEWDDAETALKAALHHLRHLSKAWKKVLSRNVYHITMGNLVDTVFVFFLEPVLKASEISEPASRFVHYLFLEAVKNSVEVFRTDETVDDDVEGLFKVATKNAVEFEKLQAVGHFMVMRLDDVQRGLEEGKFGCVKAKELSSLIAAAFDESEKRRSLLNSLTSK